MSRVIAGFITRPAFVTAFSKDLEAVGKAVLITLENDGMSGRAETGGESGRQSSKTRREAVMGAEGRGIPQRDLIRLRFRGLFSSFSSKKRPAIAFVDEVRQEGLGGGRHPWGAFPPPLEE